MAICYLGPHYYTGQVIKSQQKNLINTHTVKLKLVCFSTIIEDIYKLINKWFNFGLVLQLFSFQFYDVFFYCWFIKGTKQSSFCRLCSSDNMEPQFAIKKDITEVIFSLNNYFLFYIFYLQCLIVLATFTFFKSDFYIVLIFF
jgi:hypothetical protein